MKTFMLIAVLVAAFLALPTGLDSCAIGPPEPIFATKKRPGDRHNEFLRGKLGVIQSRYEQRDLISAYRILSGQPLSADEEAEIYRPEEAQPVDTFNRTSLDAWFEVRGRVAGMNDDLRYRLSPYKSRPTDYLYFRNCLDDAFHTARATFEKRAEKWGADSPQLREWLTAQDLVFTNCSATTASIPDAPTPQMDPLLAADREYQIAAALFYAGQWEKSRQAFDRIAQSKTSPWRTIAPYVAARTSIREGLLDDRPEALNDAERRLKAIAGDPKHEWREASQRLLSYVRLQADPVSRMKELGTLLSGPGKGAEARASLEEFSYLYNRLGSPRGSASIAKLAASTDLADWLLSVDGHSDGTINHHALDQWRKKRTPAWLIAALVRADDPKDMDEVVAAARRVLPSAPAYESAAYYGIAHEARSGRKDSARRWADEALRHKLTVSGRNLILAERMKLARNWNEFVRDAPRRPEPKVVLFDNNEVDSEEQPVETKTAPLFDYDSADLFNRRIPLRLWVEAAADPLLSPHLQLQLAQTGWFRAALLGRSEEARKLMDRIVQMQPQAAAAARELSAAKDPAEARFAAVFLMMRAPRLRPFVPVGNVLISDLSSLKDRPVSAYWGFENCMPFAADPNAADGFLTSPQRAEATAEWEELEATAPSGANYFAEQTLLWARSHPDDPRVPQALHLAVQGTRYGCKDKDTGDYSKQAFQLLHQRYPKSPWTAKTKYWYK